MDQFDNQYYNMI